MKNEILTACCKNPALVETLDNANIDTRLLGMAMKKHGDTYETLSNALGVSVKTLIKRIMGLNGNDFIVQDIQTVTKRYSLSGLEMEAIFFPEEKRQS
jgi:predicted transcriptional regulator